MTTRSVARWLGGALLAAVAVPASGEFQWAEFYLYGHWQRDDEFLVLRDDSSFTLITGSDRRNGQWQLDQEGWLIGGDRRIWFHDLLLATGDTLLVLRIQPNGTLCSHERPEWCFHRVPRSVVAPAAALQRRPL